MAAATKQTPKGLRRIWHAPTSIVRWYWLGGSFLFYIGLLAWYFYAIKTQQFPGPLNDPLRLFGITASVLVLSTAAYSLRRRFTRGLPGKVQAWLWMHTWVGIITILIVFLHENFQFITHDFCTYAGCLTDTYWAGGALFSLIFLVVSGVTGRLLDIWQTRVIAKDASTNGVGIVRALQERILELEYVVERLCAGKSEPFKHYCLQAIDAGASFSGSRGNLPSILKSERADFQHAYETLTRRTQLMQSLRVQRRARLIIRAWRSIHIVLACLALLVILYHSTMELLTNVFHILRPA
jgi:hypothetical protein